MKRLRWRVETMCADCPFSKTEAGRALRASLRPGRMENILATLRNDGHFLCHKTTTETGNGTNLQCAGALAWQKKQGLPPNQLARIAERISAMRLPSGTATTTHTSVTATNSAWWYAEDAKPAPKKRGRPSTKWMPITEHDVTPVHVDLPRSVLNPFGENDDEDSDDT